MHSLYIAKMCRHGDIVLFQTVYIYSVEEIHTVGTINNVETSYYTRCH